MKKAEGSYPSTTLFNTTNAYFEMIKKIALITTLLCMVSCTSRIVDFTILSTKNIDLARMNSYERASGRTEGEDTKHIIIVFPTGNPSVKEAIDRAIEAVPGAVALVDGVVTSKFFYIPYLFGASTYVVEGTPLIDPQLASIGTPQSDYLIVYANENSDAITTVNLTRGEYVDTLQSGIISINR